MMDDIHAPESKCDLDIYGSQIPIVGSFEGSAK